MKFPDIDYKPVEGKTYSLFGNTLSTVEYYTTIRSLADTIIEGKEIAAVLEVLRKQYMRKRYLRKIVSSGNTKSLIAYCLNSVNDSLKQYTVNTNGHVRTLPFSKIWDRRLSTTEEQYHLYMLEIELTNRLNRSSFLAAGRKISLQPYCLQDFSVDCKASDTGFDYQCRHCSGNCFQNHAGRILKEKSIEPYIWMGASIRGVVKETKQSDKTLGILGIACIPELVFGMRKCVKYKIPVIGLPLNANRCVRWFGEFRPNSVDLSELEALTANVPD